jgi:hypothetical protein
MTTPNRQESAAPDAGKPEYISPLVLDAMGDLAKQNGQPDHARKLYAAARTIETMQEDLQKAAALADGLFRERCALQAELTTSRAATDKTRQEADALLSQVQRWRPIESAPKDGTFILGYRIGRAGPPAPCRYVVDAWSDAEDEPIIDPTHWMPLPLPPKET